MVSKMCAISYLDMKVSSIFDFASTEFLKMSSKRPVLLKGSCEELKLMSGTMLFGISRDLNLY